MKRFFTLILVMFLFTGLVLGQAISTSSSNKEAISNFKYHKLMPEKIKASQFITKKNNKSTAGRWYDYALTMQNINFPDGTADNRNWEYLFPDTTVMEKYTDGASNPWIHAIGVVLDPADAIFHDDALFNMWKVHYPFPVDTGQYCNYTIDTVGIPTIYMRNIPNTAIVDTLAVEIITNLHKPVYYFGGMEANYNSKNVYFLALQFDAMMNYAKNDPNANYKIVKIPLKDADSSAPFNGYIRLKEFAAVPKGLAGGTGLAAITFRFIPGYTWTPTDTINVNLNNFRFFAYEENGLDVPIFPRYDSAYYNETSFLTTQSMRATSGWNGFYLPRYAYTSNVWPWDNALVDIHVTCNNAAIAETPSKSVRLTQNIPNPAGNSTEIFYEIKQANNVNFVITDMTGREIMKINQGNQIAGIHSITINTSSLSSGLYYYTLNADNIKLTKKMIINR
jgi:hypothetical protein